MTLEQDMIRKVFVAYEHLVDSLATETFEALPPYVVESVTEANEAKEAFRAEEREFLKKWMKV